MVARRVLTLLSALDEASLTSLLQQHGVKESHGRTIISHVIRTRGLGSFTDIPKLPQPLYSLLEDSFAACSSEVVDEQTSQDGDTTKLLIRLQDGLTVEAVIMRYDASEGRYNGYQRPGGERATLCVSSQVGCAMGCSFCATGTMSRPTSLTAGEILEQLLLASQRAPIRNVVFMGMGEPFNNHAAVKAAVELMVAPYGFHLSPNHITVSTVGVVPRIRSFASAFPSVNLALSLHAPSQALRISIVPSARAYPLEKVMQAIDEYQRDSGRRVFIEYILLGGVNDGINIAHELGTLLQSRDVVVNLIPYNHTDVVAQYRPSTPEAAEGFQKVLRGSYGLRTTIRREKGNDIAGACGQLAVKAGTGGDSRVLSEGIKEGVDALMGVEGDSLSNGKTCGSRGGVRAEKKACGGANGTLLDIEDIG